MGLQQTQHILAKLYTETSFRENFFKKPAEVGNEFKLTVEEVNELIKLEKDIVFFASSLITKRREEVKKITPMLLEYLKKPKFNELFLAFSNTFTPKGIKKHLEDAYYFILFLEKKTIKEIDSIFLKELIKLEKTHVKRLYLKERFGIYLLKYKTNELEKKIRDNSYVLKFRPSIFMFFEYGDFYKSFSFGF